MSILIIGGMHGNEPLGVNLVNALKKKPVDGVDYIIANPRAVRRNVRCTETDLNRSFSGDSRLSYEEKRARFLKKKCKQYDIVLDFHNTLATANDCSFVGIGCNPLLYEVSLQLGLERCIEATYECINKWCQNTLSIEISVDSKRNAVEFWYELLQGLVNGVHKPKNQTLKIFRFAGRLEKGECTRKCLKTVEAFTPLVATDMKKLGYDRTVYPIFIGSSYTEYEATLITKERNVVYE